MPRLDPANLLKAHRVAHVTDTDALQAYQTGVCGGGRFRREVADVRPFRVQLRHAVLERIEVALLWSAGEMTVEANLDAGYPYLLQFPLSQTIDIELDGRSIQVVPGSALVMSPPVRARRRNRRGWTLVLALSRALTHSRLAARLGHAPSGRVAFSPLITAGAAELLDFCIMLVQAIDRGQAAPGRSTSAVLEAGLVDVLLDLQPHTHTTAMERVNTSSTTGRLDAIERFLRAHMSERLTVSHLARSACCSVRSLQTLMLEQYGMGPAEFMRRQRLVHARSLLQGPIRTATVAEIARQSGFTHLGRFTSSYKRLFGESPSDTSRRGRRTPLAASEKR